MRARASDRIFIGVPKTMMSASVFTLSKLHTRNRSRSIHQTEHNSRWRKRRRKKKEAPTLSKEKGREFCRTSTFAALLITSPLLHPRQDDERARKESKKRILSALGRESARERFRKDNCLVMNGMRCFISLMRAVQKCGKELYWWSGRWNIQQGESK